MKVDTYQIGPKINVKLTRANEVYSSEEDS